MTVHVPCADQHTAMWTSQIIKVEKQQKFGEKGMFKDKYNVFEGSL